MEAKKDTEKTPVTHSFKVLSPITTDKLYKQGETIKLSNPEVIKTLTDKKLIK